MRLLLPPGMRWAGVLGASTFGGEYIPAGIRWPDQADYTKGLIDGVGALTDATDLSYDEGGLLSPPIMAHVAALRATVEATTGLSLAQLTSLANDIRQLSSATNPAQVALAVTQLIGDVLEVVTSVSKATGIATGILKVAPIIGQIISMITPVMEFVVDILESQERIRQAGEVCQQRVMQEQNATCQQLVTQATPNDTEEGGVSPADMFRPVMVAMQTHQPLPITTASLFVALCGGETQGAFSLFTRQSWLKFVDQHGKGVLGIPQLTQRRMWTLIKAIMASTREPSYSSLFAPGDSGRSLFPALLDIVWNMALSGARVKPLRAGAAIDDAFVGKISRAITSQYETAHSCKDLVEGERAAGPTPFGASSCADFIDLLPPYQKLLQAYKAHLESSGMLRSNWTWRVGGERIAAASSGRAPQAMLVLGPNTVAQLNQTAQAIDRARDAGKKTSPWLIAGAMAAAGGGYYLGRRYRLRF